MKPMWAFITTHVNIQKFHKLELKVGKLKTVSHFQAFSLYTRIFVSYWSLYFHCLLLPPQICYQGGPLATILHMNLKCRMSPNPLPSTISNLRLSKTNWRLKYLDKMDFCLIIVLQEIVDSLFTKLIGLRYSPIAENASILKMWLHKVC